MISEDKYYTVSAINRYISYKLTTDVALRLVYVKGEISNVRISKGHMYFVLKDTESEISSIIFQNTVSKLTFLPKDGMKVLITGAVTPYEKKGTYNLIVNEIIEYGSGYLYQKFLETKERLSKIGLFDETHKKLIPKYPENIGVITSSTADAFRDINSTINRRYPLANIILYPSLVQGPDAPKSIIKALKRIEKDNNSTDNILNNKLNNKYRKIDVVIIARGGGSFEDLNCFNDELLAKTIYEFPIPVVSGVGHETDYTICDFVSDARAETPTAAAVKVTPDKFELIRKLDDVKDRINVSFNKNIENNQLMLDNLINSFYLKDFENNLIRFNNNYNLLKQKLELNSPSSLLDKSYLNVLNLEKRLELLNLPNKIENEKDKIDQIVSNIYKVMNNKINSLEAEFESKLDKLIYVNPLNIMKKGYTIVYKDDKLIASSKDIKINDELDIHFYDGKNKVKVLK